MAQYAIQHMDGDPSNLSTSYADLFEDALGEAGKAEKWLPLGPSRMAIIWEDGKIIANFKNRQEAISAHAEYVCAKMYGPLLYL